MRPHEEAIAFLARPVLHLQEYCAFQEVYWASDEPRTRLCDFVDLVEQRLDNGASAGQYATVLLWGNPGSGKTFLAEQTHAEIVARLGRDIAFEKMDLRALTAAALTKRLAKLRQALQRGRRVLVFIDELDKWEASYRLLHDAADWNLTGNKVVWIFAGSLGPQMKHMLDRVKRYSAGEDLLSRIRSRVALPAVTDPRDKIVITAAVAKAKGIDRIDKAALLAIGMNEDLDSIRKVSQTVLDACLRSRNKRVIDFFAVFESKSEAFAFAREYPKLARRGETIRIA